MSFIIAVLLDSLLTTSVCLTHVAGVLSLGGDSLAATVSQLLPDLLLLHPADTSQDAPSRLAAAGTAAANQKCRTVWHLRLKSSSWCKIVTAVTSRCACRACWALRTSGRCTSSQSKTSTATLCWCCWRTWALVPTWTAFAGRSSANCSCSASPSHRRRSPPPWTSCSLNSTWVSWVSSTVVVERVC